VPPSQHSLTGRRAVAAVPQIDDLLAPELERGQNLKFGTGGVMGLTWVPCKTPEELLAAFSKGCDVPPRLPIRPPRMVGQSTCGPDGPRARLFK